MKQLRSRQDLRWTFSMLLFVCGPVTAAQERLPEEVEVIGRRPLYELREEAYKAQDAVYALYNELNTDDLYDVHCRWEEPLGTNIRHRVCRPVFLDQATRARGQDFYANVTGQGMNFAPTVEIEFARHQPIFREKLEEAVRSNPELAAAMREHQILLQELKERSSTAATSD